MAIQTFEMLHTKKLSSNARQVLLLPIHFLGQISYPLYLIHITCIVSIKKFFEIHHIALHSKSILEIGVLSFGLSVVIAYLLHVVIEVPGMRIGRHLILD